MRAARLAMDEALNWRMLERGARISGKTCVKHVR